MHFLKSALALLAVLGIAGSGLGGCSEAAAPEPQIRPVRTVTVEKRQIGEQFSLTGEIKAQDEVNLAFRIDGKLIERPVNLGDKVTAGQLIGRIDSENQRNNLRSAQADVAAAQAVLTQARTTEGRQKDLLDKGVINRAHYDDAVQSLQTAQSNYDSAQARLRNAEDQLGYTELRADAPGTVTAKGAEPGEVVKAGAAIVTVARQGGKDAVFDVPAQIIRLGRPGEVLVSLAENPNIKTTGRVREVSPQADPVLRTYQVKIGLIDPPQAMFLGATVVGRIVQAPEMAIEIPASSLTRSDGKPAVWVVDKGTSTVSLRPIEVGRYTQNSVIVAQGLQEGDVVITAGVQALRPGQKVKLLGASP